jgi:hypothetical protein
MQHRQISHKKVYFIEFLDLDLRNARASRPSGDFSEETAKPRMKALKDQCKILRDVKERSCPKIFQLTTP